MELLTIGAIYSIKFIIDYLNSREELFPYYAVTLFGVFAVTRLLAVLVRNYYDLHVYNYYKFI